jgi:hypothetical protein
MKPHAVKPVLSVPRTDAAVLNPLQNGDWAAPNAVLSPAHTSVISLGELAAASYLRLGKPRCIDLIHTCLRPRCYNVRSRGHRKSLRLRSGTVSQMLKLKLMQIPAHM